MNEAALNKAAEALAGSRKWKHLNRHQRESMRLNAARIIRVYEAEVLRQDNIAEDDGFPAEAQTI